MRNISPASLAKLAEKTGTEPVTIIEVDWAGGGNRAKYADKTIEGMEGRILVVDQFEDVINVSKSGTSQSVSVTLDDSDGQLKNIFNSCDVHKRRVWIYQWFIGIPITEKFLIFSGEIASPVSWKEGDRTLSFTVISQSTALEVGFAPEDGSFPNLPQTLVGRVWPLCFGTCMKVPLVLIDDIPHGSGDSRQGDSSRASTKDATGIKDPSLKKQIDDNSQNANYSGKLAQLYFIGYLQASHTAREKGELGDLDDIDKGKGPYSSLAKQYLALGNKELANASKIKTKTNKLQQVENTQKSHEKDTIAVLNGSLFPQGQPITLNIAGAIHGGYFLGDDFHIESRTHPDNELYDGLTVEDPATRTGDPVITRTKFFYADAGAPLAVSVLADADPNTPVIPIRYIVAATIQVTVSVVYAYRTINGIRSLYVVPSNYYGVFQVNFGSLPVTLIYLAQPLSSRNFANGESEGWEDELWASVVSPVGPNTVDIIEWLIETYTDKTIDPTSFAAVRTYLDPYPSHFAVLDRPNVLSLLADIAYQARCLIYLKNDVFYIKYLSKKEAAIDSITEEDVLEGTLEVTYTETEDIVTKYIAEWKSDYKQSKNNLIIHRYNIPRYGVQEKRHDYFIYNMQALVQKSATFWLIRDANTYKKVTLQCCISKINIESLDTVTLDFTNSFIANGPIDCLVESAVFDSNEYTVTFTLWCPVRAGEMTEYLFAFPADLTTQYVFPTPEDISTGRAGGATTAPTSAVELPTSTGNKNLEKPMTGDQGNGGQIQVTKRPLSYGADPAYIGDSGNATPTITSRIDSTAIRGTGQKPAGTTTYQYDKMNVTAKTPIPEPTNSATNVYTGRIVSAQAHDTYTVNIYQKGINNSPTTITGVKVPEASTTEDFEDDTSVMVLKVEYTDDAGNPQTEYYMQPAVWQ